MIGKIKSVGAIFYDINGLPSGAVLNNILKQNKMKKQLFYRIYIYPKCPSMFEKIAVIAAKHNGEQTRYTIPELAAIAKGICSEYPSTTENTTIEQIGDNLLHIDTKVGETYQTVMRLELVELLEPVFVEEEDTTNLSQQG
jgi:hypothetical protein